MASGDCDEALKTIVGRAAQNLGYDNVKAEQMKVVASVVHGRDVFAVLPTGFGKSFCYSVLPYVYDQLYPGMQQSIILVVTPLTAIMKDVTWLATPAMPTKITSTLRN